MQTLTSTFLYNTINSIYPDNVKFEREEVFVSLLLCKNLADLCETCSVIIDKLNDKRDLPNQNYLSLLKTGLRSLYSEDMFNDEVNWNIINNYSNENRTSSIKIFKSIEYNIKESKYSNDIRTSLEKRNRFFFINHYDELLSNVPFKDILSKFKTLLIRDDVSDSDREIVWQYFDVIFDIVFNKEEIIDDLTSQ